MREKVNFLTAVTSFAMHFHPDDRIWAGRLDLTSDNPEKFIQKLALANRLDME